MGGGGEEIPEAVTVATPEGMRTLQFLQNAFLSCVEGKCSFYVGVGLLSERHILMPLYAVIV